MVITSTLGARSEVEKDLLFLECVRLMRVRFSELICQKSQSNDPKVLDTLRIEAAFQIAEFFYLLSAQGISTLESVEALANAHNDYIIQLAKDKSKMARLGLSSERLLDAMFTSDTLPRLLQNWRDKPGSIDQSNLARFLMIVMSTETCRKVMLAFDAAGFVARQKTSYGTMVICSRGIVEETFSDCLRESRMKLAR
jgi:hypothetical protein